jgi:hypothetical protein
MSAATVNLNTTSKFNPKNNRQHTVVEKDYYRLLKSENSVNKSIKKKRASEMGRCVS